MSALGAIALDLVGAAFKIAPEVIAAFAGHTKESFPDHLARARAAIKDPTDVTPADNAFDEAFERALDGKPKP